MADTETIKAFYEGDHEPAVGPDHDLIRKTKEEAGRKASEAVHAEDAKKVSEFYRTGDPVFDKAQDDRREADQLVQSQVRLRQEAEARLHVLNPDCFPEAGLIATREHEIAEDLKVLKHLTRSLVDPLDGHTYEITGSTRARKSFLRKHSMSDEGNAAELRDRVALVQKMPQALRNYLVDKEVLGEAEATKTLRAAGFGTDQMPRV